jgi:CII-binding regulator of phage lambda lysogenization HflD
MDVPQLEQLVKTLTEDIQKEERELLQLTVKVNDLKRKLPENKRKLETAKRDLLATQALQRRRQAAAQEGRNTT